MRRPITLITLLLIVLTALAAIAVNAQDEGETPDDALTALLPITEDVRYQVGIGDTLDDIAAIFDVDLACLTQANNLANPNIIQVGDILAIPVSCPNYIGLNYVPFPRPPVEQGGGDSGEQLYVVRPADTLDEIALAFDVSTISLQEYNEIADPRTISAGDVLAIPPGAPPYGQVPPLADGTIEQGGAEGDIIYVVQPRDTLDVIGAFYNANPACIAETNGIDNPLLLQPRTTLLISQACAPYVGPNTVGGRIVDENAPTAAPTTVITTTPRPTTGETGGSVATPTAETLINEATAAAPTRISIPTQSPTEAIGGLLSGATQAPTEVPTLAAATAIPTEAPAIESTAIIPTTAPEATPTLEVLGEVEATEEAEATEAPNATGGPTTSGDSAPLSETFQNIFSNFAGE